MRTKQTDLARLVFGVLFLHSEIIFEGFHLIFKADREEPSIGLGENLTSCSTSQQLKPYKTKAPAASATPRPPHHHHRVMEAETLSHIIHGFTDETPESLPDLWSTNNVCNRMGDLTTLRRRQCCFKDGKRSSLVRLFLWRATRSNLFLVKLPLSIFTPTLIP